MQEAAPVAAVTEPQHTQLEGTQPAGPDLSAAKADATPQQPAFTSEDGMPAAATPEQATAAVPEEATPQTAAAPEEATAPVPEGVYFFSACGTTVLGQHNGNMTS